MPLNALKSLLIVHSHFILKPNPYITKEEAQSAYAHYISFNWLAVSGAASAALRAFRIAPRFTASGVFGGLITCQLLSSLVFVGLYAKELRQLQRAIPPGELESRQ